MRGIGARLRLGTRGLAHWSGAIAMTLFMGAGVTLGVSQSHGAASDTPDNGPTASLEPGHPGSAGAAASRSPSPAPDIVLILTDDQRWDELGQMPNVRRLLIDRGIRFTNGFVVNSICCPSRSTILTGQYSHSTGVYKTGGAYGGYKAFRDASTVATWLHDAGYRTGLFGKYLNGYEDTRIPPGWDRWFAFQQNDRANYYYDYEANDQGDRPRVREHAGRLLDQPGCKRRRALHRQRHGTIVPVRGSVRAARSCEPGTGGCRCLPRHEASTSARL
jgi:hypothetical protein